MTRTSLSTSQRFTRTATAFDRDVDAKRQSNRHAWRCIYDGRKSIWAMSHMSTVDKALPNSHWDARGLKTLWQRYQQHPARQVAPVQLTLNLG